MQVKPLQKIEEILDGKDVSHYGIMLMPNRLLPLVQKYKGEQHTAERILFTNGSLLWFFTIMVGEPTFIDGKDLPDGVLDRASIIGDIKSLIGARLPGVTAVHCPLIANSVVVPGWVYSPNRENAMYKYVVLAIGNTEREEHRIAEWPLLVTYQNTMSGQIWTRPIGQFVKRFTHELGQRDVDAAKLELVGYGESDASPLGGSLYFSWSSNAGFGEFNIVGDENGFLIQNEMMGKRFIKNILCSLVDSAKLEN